MDRLSSIGLMASRIPISAIFLVSAASKIFAFAQTQSYMAGKGMHMTGLFLVLAILFEICGGLMVLLGYYPRIGALILIFFLIPTTIVFHRDFAAAGQAAHFLKNMAILGGLIAILSVGGGEFSLSGRRPKLKNVPG